MGKGDKKTKRGKIVIGSFGVRRKKKTKTFTVIPKVEKSTKELKSAALLDTPINKKVEIPADAPVLEVPQEDQQVKKATKKPAAKKSAEKPEGDGEAKVKATKTKKKPETGEDLFTPPVE